MSAIIPIRSDGKTFVRSPGQVRSYFGDATFSIVAAFSPFCGFGTLTGYKTYNDSWPVIYSTMTENNTYTFHSGNPFGTDFQTRTFENQTAYLGTWASTSMGAGSGSVGFTPDIVLTVISDVTSPVFTGTNSGFDSYTDISESVTDTTYNSVGHSVCTGVNNSRSLALTGLMDWDTVLADNLTRLLNPVPIPDPSTDTQLIVDSLITPAMGGGSKIVFETTTGGIQTNPLPGFLNWTGACALGMPVHPSSIAIGSIADWPFSGQNSVTDSGQYNYGALLCAKSIWQLNGKLPRLWQVYTPIFPTAFPPLPHTAVYAHVLDLSGGAFSEVEPITLQNPLVLGTGTPGGAVNYSNPLTRGRKYTFLATDVIPNLPANTPAWKYGELGFRSALIS